MLSLTRHGAEVDSVFALMGGDEGSLAAALSFALSRCPQLGAAITKRLARAARARLKPGSELHVALEECGNGGGAGLEIRQGALFILRVGAGWGLPSAAQLAQDAERVAAAGVQGAVVSLSQASQALARECLPREVGGVPVIHMGWRDVAAEVEQVRTTCRGLRERVWLDEFRSYLAEVIRVRRVEDSWTYCVVLTNDKPGETATFKEIVNDQRRYFHPYGVSGWPTEPPNFIAFRWDGAVRLIHRVESYEVVPRLSDEWPDMTSAPASRPHVVYQLGARLPPYEPIANGPLPPSLRLWVLLDQLQTAPNLAQAYTRSKELSA